LISLSGSEEIQRFQMQGDQNRSIVMDLNPEERKFELPELSDTPPVVRYVRLSTLFLYLSNRMPVGTVFRARKRTQKSRRKKNKVTLCAVMITINTTIPRSNTANSSPSLTRSYAHNFPSRHRGNPPKTPRRVTLLRWALHL
jgi:hypothetical protein